MFFTCFHTCFNAVQLFERFFIQFFVSADSMIFIFGKIETFQRWWILLLQSKHCTRIPCIRKWGAGFCAAYMFCGRYMEMEIKKLRDPEILKAKKFRCLWRSHHRPVRNWGTVAIGNQHSYTTLALYSSKQSPTLSLPPQSTGALRIGSSGYQTTCQGLPIWWRQVFRRTTNSELLGAGCRQS